MAAPILAMVAAQAANQGMAALQDIRQQNLNRKSQDQAAGYSKELMDFQQQKQLEMWEKTGYGAQMKQMRGAGLNPALMYGMGGGGGQTTGNTGASVSAMPIQTKMGLDAQMTLAQMELIKSQTEKTKAETAKTEGVDTENVKADTENKILSGVIAKYTGLEARDVYERIKSPNRSIEAKTYQEELEARQGIAGTIYEMWKEGKLKDKSLSEVEQALLVNAKTREEIRLIYKQIEMLERNIKGADLDNIMKDLEMRLQKETGIDRNSPTWLKVLGRLFVELMK